MTSRSLLSAATRRTLLTVLALVVSFIFIAPFLWVVLTSLKTEKDLFTAPVQVWPSQGFHFDAYARVWREGRFGQYFWNSVLVSTATTAISVAIATLAGLGFARYKLRGGKYLLLSILLSQLFPLVLLVPSFYVVLRQFVLLDNLLGLVIIYISFTLPYGVWMLTGYFRSIPVDLEEAAMIDGASRLGAYLRVTLPLAAPGIAATVIYCFILAWNEYMFAATFISSRSLRTLPLGLQSFIGQYNVDWNLLMAGSVVTTIPVVVLFLALQRYLVSGLTAGAVKG